MNKIRSWLVGLTIVSLLVVGVVAVAGNGFGDGASIRSSRQSGNGECHIQRRGADGDGVLNSEDRDWARPLDGSGHGACKGYRRNLSGNRPLDGSGYGARRGGGAGQASGSESCDGGCL